jgi:hypothetical protein
MTSHRERDRYGFALFAQRQLVLCTALPRLICYPRRRVASANLLPAKTTAGGGNRKSLLRRQERVGAIVACRHGCG